MTPFPSKPPGRSPASVTTTESAHVVWLRLDFSGRYVDAAIAPSLYLHILGGYARPASTH